MLNYGLNQNSVKVLSYFETKDYSLFVNTVINRELDVAHVKALAEDIKVHGLLRPLNVVRLGNKYHVYDGGHRLEACKLADVAVKFIVDAAVKTTKELVQLMVTINRSREIKDKDYVKIYASTGNNNYVEYQNFKQKYGSDFKHGAIINILTVDGGDGNTSKKFKNEKFVVGNLISAYRFADDLISVKQSNPREYNQEKFIQALIPYWMNPAFSINTLLNSLRKPKFARIFDGIYNVPVYKATIHKVYNDSLPMNRRITA